MKAFFSNPPDFPEVLVTAQFHSTPSYSWVLLRLTVREQDSAGSRPPPFCLYRYQVGKGGKELVSSSLNSRVFCLSHSLSHPQQHPWTFCHLLNSLPLGSSRFFMATPPTGAFSLYSLYWGLCKKGSPSVPSPPQS